MAGVPGVPSLCVRFVVRPSPRSLPISPLPGVLSAAVGTLLPPPPWLVPAVPLAPEGSSGVVGAGTPLPLPLLDTTRGPK